MLISLNYPRMTPDVASSPRKLEDSTTGTTDTQVYDGIVRPEPRLHAPRYVVLGIR